MNPKSSRRFSLLRASAAALPFAPLLVAAPGPSPSDAAAAALVAKVEAARGRSTKPLDTLVIEGTFTVSALVPDPTDPTKMTDYPFARGSFRELFAGADQARHTGEMEGVAPLERGVTGERAWEVEPMAGAKVHAADAASTSRRHFALLRGAKPTTLYREMALAGTQELDGRPLSVLRMTPQEGGEGKTDTWYVDEASARVHRIDLTLPSPTDCVLVYGFPAEVETQITFGDWKRVDGVDHPHRRTTKMGPITLDYTCTTIEAGAQIEADGFALPEAVRKATAATAAGGPSSYEIVDRPAQPVASIRVKCKPAETSATLAVLLPEVLAHVNACGGKLAGVPFSRYHSPLDGKEAEVDLEAGIPVAKPIPEQGRVKNSELPAGWTACVWHVGPYDGLTEAHGKLRAHVATQGLKSRGGPWEIYWTDPGMVPDPAKWRTQLFLPVEK